MSKAPVSLCMIVKNEPMLEVCLNSIKDFVEEIIIVDTGSTDNTLEIAKKYANVCVVYTDCNDPKTGKIDNFSQARQLSFDLATQPWVMWMDSDDIIVGGENLINLTKIDPIEHNVDSLCFMFPYQYSFNDKGECTLIHYRERLIYNKNYYNWVNPVHEVLIPKENINASIKFIIREDLVYKHQRQYNNKQIEPGRNLRILEKYIKDHSDDSRQYYYIGLEYFNSGMIDNAYKYLSEYINMSKWDDEKCMACLKLVEICYRKEDYEDGVKWAFKAIETKEDWCEGYFCLAKMFYFLAIKGGDLEGRSWQKCAHFARIGLSLPPTKTLLFVNPQERDFIIHKYLNVALGKIGNVSAALDSVNAGLSKNPTDEGLLSNKKYFETIIYKNNAIVSVNKLYNTGYFDNITFELLSDLINKKEKVNENKFLSKHKQDEFPLQVMRRSSITGLDIIFYLGDGLESWTPETVKKNGIGGSETAAIEIAKRLASMGHRVRVYSSCGVNGEGLYDNVEYYQSYRYKNLECDVLIISRNATMLDDFFGIKANLKLLWCHDVVAANASNSLLLKADRILALSEWHKQNLMKEHNLNSEHIIVTRNGIDLTKFNLKQDRNKFKVINSSSPDRSWEMLLHCWPKIKERAPQAELHLFYGFTNWKVIAKNRPEQAKQIKSIENKIEALKKYDVIYRGRLSQKELAKEFLSSGVMAYPTWFQETSCISMMEAQAAGLRIITSAKAALNETVGNRGILISDEWATPEYKTLFINSVVNAIESDDDSDRAKLQKYAKKHFGWNQLAKEWDKMFYNLIDELKTNPIVPYQPTINY